MSVRLHVITEVKWDNSVAGYLRAYDDNPIAEELERHESETIEYYLSDLEWPEFRKNVEVKLETMEDKKESEYLRNILDKMEAHVKENNEIIIQAW